MGVEIGVVFGSGRGKRCDCRFGLIGALFDLPESEVGPPEGRPAGIDSGQGLLLSKLGGFLGGCSHRNNFNIIIYSYQAVSYLMHQMSTSQLDLAIL